MTYFCADCESACGADRQGFGCRIHVPQFRALRRETFKRLHSIHKNVFLVAGRANDRDTRLVRGISGDDLSARNKM